MEISTHCLQSESAWGVGGWDKLTAYFAHSSLKGNAWFDCLPTEINGNKS